MNIFEHYSTTCRHYSDPYIPDLPGMKTYLGRLLHSHSYRTPSAFRDQTVLVLGAGPSGKDIAADLVPEAKKVITESICSAD